VQSQPNSIKPKMRGHKLKWGVNLQEAIKYNDMKQGLPAYYSKSVHFQIALMMSLLTLTNCIWGGGELIFILAKPNSQILLLIIINVVTEI
jgi:hypothetical protein